MAGAGLALLLLSTVGLIVFPWKHRSAKYAYKFSFRKMVDLWAMSMIFAAFSTGLYLLIARGA